MGGGQAGDGRLARGASIAGKDLPVARTPG
jgi:hypothetical protein